jgi:hypothetical protein
MTKLKALHLVLPAGNPFLSGSRVWSLQNCRFKLLKLWCSAYVFGEHLNGFVETQDEIRELMTEDAYSRTGAFVHDRTLEPTVLPKLRVFHAYHPVTFFQVVPYHAVTHVDIHCVPDRAVVAFLSHSTGPIKAVQVNSIMSLVDWSDVWGLLSHALPNLELLCGVQLDVSRLYLAKIRIPVG